MLGAYNIDSDDDEEDEWEAPTNIPKSASTHIKELEKLKEKTGELIDSSWKEQRNRHLLMKMLELEEPTVTAKMVDFLLQDGVCDILLSIITQIGTNQPRPSPSDSKSEALKLSYRAVMLLTADEPTEALMTFLSKRAGVLARGIFEIYHDDSAASFYHFYRMLECLLRCFPGDVYESICSDGQMAMRMRRMTRYIGYAPVGESVAMLIALTPVPRMSQLYLLSSKNRWLFFEQLSQKNFMLSLVEIIVFPEEFCYVTGYINAEQHSSCATFVLQELVEKLSVEETGELLLQPFGYTNKLLEHLIDTSLSGSVISIRRSSTKLLCFLLRRVADSDILYMVSAGVGAAPTPAYVPNRLFPLRDRIINQIFLRIKCFMSALVNSDDTDGVRDDGNFASETSDGPVKYSSYSVPKPFTVIRSVFFELITLMVESDDTVAELIPVELWQLLIKWTLKYAHNSIFHSIFFRLIYSVLRQEQEAPQINLFEKANFADFLMDSFLPFPLDSSNLPRKDTSEEEINKYVARGIILNLANAVRLQISTQLPSAFLRNYLSNDERWCDFLDVLQAATAVQQTYAFGIKVPEHNKLNGSKDGNNGYGLNGDRAEEISQGGETGSRYARSLGFYEDPVWVQSNTNSNSGNGNGSGNSNGYEENNSNGHSQDKKTEKNKKKKSKKKRTPGSWPPLRPYVVYGDEKADKENGDEVDDDLHEISPEEAQYEEKNRLDEILRVDAISMSDISEEGNIGAGYCAEEEDESVDQITAASSLLYITIPSSSSIPSPSTSSPGKVGGSLGGKVICVTEICCDEIDANDKIEKSGKEGYDGLYSRLADDSDELPVSGSI